MTSSVLNDVGFFELVHQIRASKESESFRERRRGERRHYRSRQRVAPAELGEIPPPDEFREVDCADLSVSGFSFYAPKPPDYRSLVVGLGDETTTIYLNAVVVRWTEVRREFDTVYLVGCQFTGRMAE